ncbi:hypothetical protein AVEN_52649-1 [Araneus ventricosus]|uniref:Uncharacterized protein n=1 Tax=Araneus ventricosus TaxID=182803 RepID=A0A4Y2N5I2_ARAVE|nr:hypothetical protein AVEN_52649-1 [Araneus ventricosus]
MKDQYKLNSVYSNNALGKKTYGHMKDQYKLNSVYSNNALGKKTYGHMKDQYKLNSVYSNNALGKKTYGHMKDQYKLNSVYSNNALGKKTYGHMKDQYKLNSVYSNNALGKKTYGHMKNLYKLSSVYYENALEQRLRVDRSQHVNRRQTSMRQDLYLEAFRYDPTKDYWLHTKAVVGKMNVVCKYCRANKFKCETLGMFGSNGKVKRSSLDQPPEPLYSLISGVTLESAHFLQNNRKYNACFQMTSFGTTAVVREEGFMPAFKIQGQIYHRIGSLLPFQDRTPQFL